MVDYDDESAAQMLPLLQVIQRKDKTAFIDNISLLKLGYEYDHPKDKVLADDKNECYPVWNLNNKKIRCLLNQYPKEWLVNEIERDELLKYDLAGMRTIEPWWKLILGNKALLPLLWEMYPGHENLLPAFFDVPASSINGAVDSKEISKK